MNSNKSESEPETRNQKPETNVTLRPVVTEDEPFLYDLYRATRTDLGSLTLDPAQLDMLLRMQFVGQQRQYEMDFPSADHDIILLDGEPIGRVMVQRGEQQNTGVDIALIPEQWNSGIGTVMIGDLIKEAHRAGKPFQIHVERSNRAIRLYERLGFKTVGETPTHLFMECAIEKS